MNARTIALLAQAAACAAGVAGILPATAVRAEDMPVFKIEFNDGTVEPLRLEVPANKPFKIVLENKGKTPAEFESLKLHREKVLAAESSSFMVIQRLAPGEYTFFDDFHPNAPQAVLIAK